MTRETRCLDKVIETNGVYELIECFPVFLFHTHKIRENGKIIRQNGRFTKRQARMWFRRFLASDYPLKVVKLP